MWAPVTGTNAPTADDLSTQVHVRALFISDVHLGTRTAQADQLLDLLRRCEADTVYLVADIVDFWRVRRGPIWPQSHNDVLQKLMRKVRKGARLVLIPGNHDEGLRDYAGMQFGGIEIHRDCVHVTAQGRRYVVMHGDEFDVVVRTAKWLALLGDRGYELALWLNHPLNWVRRHLGLGYWSFSATIKYRVKKAVAFIGAFEEAVAAEARRRKADGIICGHIHHASDRTFEGIHYLNCGDWVESCTAVAESHAGALLVIRWADLQPGREHARNGVPAHASARLLAATDTRSINRIDSWTAGAWRHGLPDLVTGGEKGDMARGDRE
jgi:UDP-2,3-diacylglucosamine pyrophosphatase LpxH